MHAEAEWLAGAEHTPDLKTQVWESSCAARGSEHAEIQGSTAFAQQFHPIMLV